MPCPLDVLPGSTRELAWLAVGVGLGVAAARILSLPGLAAPRRPAAPPARLPAPSRVVELPGVFAIDEHCGNASTGDTRVSIASVTVTTSCTEATQVPAFDEYVLVQEGTMRVLVSSKDPAFRPAAHAQLEPFQVEASAGQMLWLPKGYLYTYTFPGPCSYIPVCLPAFSPELVSRLADFKG
eukprot:jgi/Tetstr1/426103/TSEL_016433.t1